MTYCDFYPAPSTDLFFFRRTFDLDFGNVTMCACAKGCGLDYTHLLIMKNGDVTVAVFSEVQNLTTSAHDLIQVAVCVSVCMSSVCGSSSNDGRLSVLPDSR